MDMATAIPGGSSSPQTVAHDKFPHVSCELDQETDPT